MSRPAGPTPHPPRPPSPAPGPAPHPGKDAILAFYTVIEPLERSTELLSFRAAGDTAIFEFRIVTVFGDITVEISPMDIMVFNADGEVASMRAVWDASEMIRH